MSKRDNLKILLLQIRHDPVVCSEEHNSFAHYSQLNINQIDILNVCKTQSFEQKIVDNYDALFVGGSSDVSVLEPETYPFVIPCQGLLNYCLAIDKPVFASCFGFQLAVLAMGGSIIRDRSVYEMGTIPVSLTPRAKTDPIFKPTPDQFLAVSVHVEKAVSLPEQCDLLAYTDQCTHAFVVKNKPFWAFQFHPEVDKETLIRRLGIYRQKYTKGDEHYESLLGGFKETPHSNQLMKYFIDHVLDIKNERN